MICLSTYINGVKWKKLSSELKKYKLFHLNWCQWPVPQCRTGRSTVQRNNKENIKEKHCVNPMFPFDATITSSARDDLSVMIKALRHKANNFMGEKWFSLMGKHQHLNNSFYPFPSFVCCWRLTILSLSLSICFVFFFNFSILNVSLVIERSHWTKSRKVKWAYQQNPCPPQTFQWLAEAVRPYC